MTLDGYGYPTEETLNEIKNHSIIKKEEIENLLSLIQDNWTWDDMFILNEQKGCLELHTGGWSGNESIICALKENLHFWMVFWYKSKRGGHYWFNLNNYKPKN